MGCYIVFWKFYLISPIVNNRKGEFKKEILDLVKKGFVRFVKWEDLHNIEIYDY